MTTKFKCMIDPNFKYNQVLTGDDHLDISIWDDGTVDIEMDAPYTQVEFTIDDLQFLLDKAKEANKEPAR
jgi:hypothetical protein